MDSCYLCGDRNVMFTGTCEANENDDSVDWLMGKLPKGKKRIFCYHLCEKCFKLANKEELIEEKLESDAKMQTGYRIKV